MYHSHLWKITMSQPIRRWRRRVCTIAVYFIPQYTKTTLSTVLVWSTQHLTHWGRVTYICVGKLIIIGSDNGLAPERRQAIIWTNAGILLIGPLGRNFFIEFSLKKICLKMSSAKCCSFRLSLNVLNHHHISRGQEVWMKIISTGDNESILRKKIAWYICLLHLDLTWVTGHQNGINSLALGNLNEILGT